MNITKARWHEDSDGTWISFLTDRKTALTMLEQIQAKEHCLELKEVKKRRSMDSNAYYWTLVSKLASKLQTSPVEIYRQHILDIGNNYEILPIKDEAVDKFKTAWSKNGIGWVTNLLGPSKLKGYTNIMAYYGSSTYDSKQMSRLVDLAVEDCKENGIDTLTPGEIAKLNQMWKEGGNG